jgi:hypothetical protein
MAIGGRRSVVETDALSRKLRSAGNSFLASLYAARSWAMNCWNHGEAALSAGAGSVMPECRNHAEARPPTPDIDWSVFRPMARTIDHSAHRVPAFALREDQWLRLRCSRAAAPEQRTLYLVGPMHVEKAPDAIDVRHGRARQRQPRTPKARDQPASSSSFLAQLRSSPDLCERDRPPPTSCPASCLRVRQIRQVLRDPRETRARRTS